MRFESYSRRRKISLLTVFFWLWGETWHGHVLDRLRELHPHISVRCWGRRKLIQRLLWIQVSKSWTKLYVHAQKSATLVWANFSQYTNTHYSFHRGCFENCFIFWLNSQTWMYTKMLKNYRKLPIKSASNVLQQMYDNLNNISKFTLKKDKSAN